jgi:hypothetical protein
MTYSPDDYDLDYQEDPKPKLPPDLQRVPKFGSNDRKPVIKRQTNPPTTPIDYPSPQKLAQQAALSSLKYSGKAKLKPEIEEDAKDILHIGEESIAKLDNHTNKLDQEDDGTDDLDPPMA